MIFLSPVKTINKQHRTLNLVIWWGRSPNVTWTNSWLRRNSFTLLNKRKTSKITKEKVLRVNLAGWVRTFSRMTLLKKTMGFCRSHSWDCPPHWEHRGHWPHEEKHGLNATSTAVFAKLSTLQLQCPRFTNREQFSPLCKDKTKAKT